MRKLADSMPHANPPMGWMNVVGQSVLTPRSKTIHIAGALVGPAGHPNSVGHGDISATAGETHANPSITTSSSAARPHRAPSEVECQEFVCAPDRAPRSLSWRDNRNNDPMVKATAECQQSARVGSVRITREFDCGDLDTAPYSEARF